jgi:hypothetical protein
MNIEGYRKNKGKEPICINLDSDEEPLPYPHQPSAVVKLEDGKILVLPAPQPPTNLPPATATHVEATPVPASAPAQC